jgi:hypothetical protein
MNAEVGMEDAAERRQAALMQTVGASGAQVRNGTATPRA